MDELNELLQKSANAMQSEVGVRFAGDLKKKNIRRILPESLCFNYVRKYEYAQLSNSEYVLRLTYMDSTRMLAAHRDASLMHKLNSDERKALLEAKRRIKACVRKGMSDLEVLKALHDDLVNRVRYDKPSGPECTTMLLQDKGVCDAYSRSLYLMLNMVNIPCHIMVGKGKGTAHAWNLVQLEQGEWYHVDATWDDPTIPGGSQVLRHNYFCLSDAEIQRDHKWNLKQFPSTPKVKGFYFREVNRYFEHYDDFWAAAEKAYRKGENSYSAYLTCFGSVKKFNKSYADYMKKGGKLALMSWVPPSGKRSGVVELAFNDKQSAPNQNLPAPDETGELPTEAMPSWLSGGMWKELVDSIDVDTMVREGSKMLLKGINTAEDMADDFQQTEGGIQEKSKAVWDGLLKKMSE